LPLSVVFVMDSPTVNGSPAVAMSVRVTVTVRPSPLPVPVDAKAAGTLIASATTRTTSAVSVRWHSLLCRRSGLVRRGCLRLIPVSELSRWLEQNAASTLEEGS
jgi:hypothetical protein